MPTQPEKLQGLKAPFSEHVRDKIIWKVVRYVYSIYIFNTKARFMYEKVPSLKVPIHCVLCAPKGGRGQRVSKAQRGFICIKKGRGKKEVLNTSQVQNLQCRGPAGNRYPKCHTAVDAGKVSGQPQLISPDRSTAQLPPLRREPGGETRGPCSRAKPTAGPRALDPCGVGTQGPEPQVLNQKPHPDTEASPHGRASP